MLSCVYFPVVSRNWLIWWILKITVYTKYCTLYVRNIWFWKFKILKKAISMLNVNICAIWQLPITIMAKIMLLYLVPIICGHPVWSSVSKKETWGTHQGGCTHMKGQYGYVWPLFQALWLFIRPPVAVCSHSEDPSLLKFLIFNQKIGKLFEFRCSQSPYTS